MTIKDIAIAINAKSSNYKIGKLQNIRKKLKGLKKMPGTKIFTDNTIDNKWAFHYGGRSEIQFNIGLEDEGLRYGLAFSLERSQTLPDISILYPKILKLNCLLIEQPELFSDYTMWFWQYGKRSIPESTYEISQNMIGLNTFIFFGKLIPIPEVNVDQILQTFDDLLQIYIIVESSKSVPTTQTIIEKQKGFKFIKKPKKLPKSTSYSTVEREINVTARHSYLQKLLIAQLEKEFGEENVSFENEFRGKRIDVVVQDYNKIYFYEVKVASSAQSCIRQAMGQLLEYAFGDCQFNAHQLFAAGEHELDKDSQKYLSFLRDEFKMAIHYIQILK